MSDSPLTEARLRAALGARPFRFYPQIGSTNDVARTWAADGAPTGSVVVAEEQISGRGRFARQWIAPPGTSLLFSVILRPVATPENLPRVAMIGALAVSHGLDWLHALPNAIKWPNDVLLAGRKVAGILPEADWQNNRLSAVALGIGLNVSSDFTDTPLADKAISIQTITSGVIDRTELLADVLRRVDFWSARVNDSILFDSWRNRLITLGQRVIVTFTDGSGSAISGQASGVDPNGALLLTDDSGVVHRVIAGEVTLSGSVSGTEADGR